MRGAAPRLGNDLARYEQPELNANTSEPDAFAASLGAGRDVVVADQFPPLHAPAVVDDRQRRTSSVSRHADPARTRIESVRDNFSEDRLFEGAGVGISQIFEQMLEVDSGFAHTGILSPLRHRARRASGASTGYVSGDDERASPQQGDDPRAATAGGPDFQTSCVDQSTLPIHPCSGS